jgi:TPR repeat protein
MTKAAASDAAALTEQGIMRTEGNGVEGDPKDGFAIITKAAEQGNTKAVYYAGLLTKMGLGIDKDPVRSAGYLKQAAEAGDDRAMFAWGAMLENEGGGGEPDPKTGTEWIVKAARAGNADAMAILALKYVRAIGVEKDDNEALSWSRTGAEGGHADCQFMAAQLLMMMNSEDPKSISEAYRWAQAAADQGNENAAEMAKDLAVKNAYQGEKK